VLRAQRPAHIQTTSSSQQLELKEHKAFKEHKEQQDQRDTRYHFQTTYFKTVANTAALAKSKNGLQL
jgi:hypothetical protein